MIKSKTSALISILFIISTTLSTGLFFTNTQDTNDVVIDSEKVKSNDDLKTAGNWKATVEELDVEHYDDEYLEVSFTVDNPSFCYWQNYRIEAGWYLAYFENFIDMFSGFEIKEDVKFYDKTSDEGAKKWGGGKIDISNMKVTPFQPGKPPLPSSIDNLQGYKPNIIVLWIENQEDYNFHNNLAKRGAYNGKEVFIGFSYIKVTVNSAGRPSNHTLEYIRIKDDDTTAPSITTEYHGSGTDEDPGYFSITATDSSDISPQDDPNGKLPLDNEIGTYTLTISATDDDNDWGNFRKDDLTTTITKKKDIVDDDTEGPTIEVDYIGNNTDANPGYLLVEASDPSGLYIDPSRRIDIPNTPDDYHYTIEATDNDNDRKNDRSSSSTEITVTIADDDDKEPKILIKYHGDGTDSNPGYLEVFASDQSGLTEDPSGNYSLEPTLIPQTFEFTAVDGDEDREGDSIEFTKSITMTLKDDDIEPPTISYEYYGSKTDEDPGYITVYAYDKSGLSFNPSGNNYLTPTLGSQTFKFTAIDADNDRPNDALRTSIYVEINITDDDNTHPNISYNYYGSYNDEEPGYIEVIAQDDSGLDVDPSGIYYLTPTLGTQTFTFTAVDSDNDRPNDSLESSVEVSINIIDDDTEKPQVLDVNVNVYPELLNVSFYATDASGIGNVEINVDGINVNPIVTNKNGDYYYYILKNEWILEKGIHEMEIAVNDGDEDRPNDSETTRLTLQFEITNEDILDFNIVKIEGIIQDLEDPNTTYPDGIQDLLSSSKDKFIEAELALNENDTEEAMLDIIIAGKLIEIAQFQVIAFSDSDSQEKDKPNVILATSSEEVEEDDHSNLLKELRKVRVATITLEGYLSQNPIGEEISSVILNIHKLECFVFDEMGMDSSFFLKGLLRTTQWHLEFSLFKLIKNHSISRDLAHSQCKLKLTRFLTEKFIARGKIPSEIGEIITGELSCIIDSIESLKNSF